MAKNYDNVIAQVLWLVLEKQEDGFRASLQAYAAVAVANDCVEPSYVWFCSNDTLKAS